MRASLFLPDADATARLGRALAPHLGRGDALLLSGDLGAGKTHLARALIQHRLAAEGIREDVPSPTFTLVQTYEADALEIWHVDLYRIGDPRDIRELGLDEAFEDALTLVEWPERLGAGAPPDALLLRLDAAGTGRRATLTATSPRWANLPFPSFHEAVPG